MSFNVFIAEMTRVNIELEQLAVDKRSNFTMESEFGLPKSSC